MKKNVNHSLPDFEIACRRQSLCEYILRNNALAQWADYFLTYDYTGSNLKFFFMYDMLNFFQLVSPTLSFS